MKNLLFIPFSASLLLVSSCSGDHPEKTTGEEKLSGPFVFKEKVSPPKSAQPGYTNHHPCTFYVSLPQDWILKETYEKETAENTDNCDYTVKTKNGKQVLEIHSLITSRFDAVTVDEFYEMAVEYSKFEISYKVQKNNWFIVSGVSAETGNVIYWKRVIGKQFVSDLYFDYPKSLSTEVEPHIADIAESFTGE